MKAKHRPMRRWPLAAGFFALVSGCVVAPDRRVEVIRPQPVVVETVMVPSWYVIADGEYIGYVGGRYYYLGHGGVWLVCDSVRLEHFHRWERSHRDWRRHAIKNDRFRKDAQGREHPWHDGPHARPGHVTPSVRPGHAQSSVRPVPNAPKVQSGRNSSKNVPPSRMGPRTQSDRGVIIQATPNKRLPEKNAY